jgi:sugar phosphate isomerase/epimerase
MSVPNPIILFNNHFEMHRRHYTFATKFAVAEDLGYDGFEFHPIEPDDEATWAAAGAAVASTSLKHFGMYVVSKGINDDETGIVVQELDRVMQIADRLAAIAPGAFVNYSISSCPPGTSSEFHESGSVNAEPRHWERAASMVREVDKMLSDRGLQGNLYNHVWFMVDTPQAELRIIGEAGATTIRPGIAAFHNHFHQGTPDVPELLDLPGMDRLGYLALLNAVPKPEPFRMVPIDAGVIDMAALLGHVWKRGYTGPIVTQAYDIGGDPYMTARRSINYIREVWDRFERNPALNPATG